MGLLNSILLGLGTVIAVAVPAVLALVVGLTTAGRTRRLAVTGLLVACGGVVLSEAVQLVRRAAIGPEGSDTVRDALILVSQAAYVLGGLAGGALVLLAVLRPRAVAPAPGGVR